MKERDYNFFSKKELVNFLSQYDKYCWHIHNPFDIMVAEKMGAVMKQIDRLNSVNHDLNVDFECVDQKIEWLLAINENQKKWVKLNKKYTKLSKLRYGE